jgi:putative transposase
MARQLRLEFPGAIYHVTSRGNARQAIFLDDHDRLNFLDILGNIIGRYNWLCHAYCLMDNHYHLLIETIDPNLSLGMRQLNGVYTQTFNRKHNRVGHVFQGRYKSIIVEKDSFLLELCRYIVLNPVKANMVREPSQWVWSSYRHTAGLTSSSDFLTRSWLLKQFSQYEKQAMKQYVEFVNDGQTQEIKSPWQHLQNQIFLGGTRFISNMREKLETQKEIGEIPRAQRYAGRPDLEVLFAAVQNKQDRNQRIKTAHLDYGYTLKQIANMVGVHYSTVSRVLTNV